MKLPIIVASNEVEDEKVRLLFSNESNKVKLDSKENPLPNTGSPMKAEQRNPAVWLLLPQGGPSIS